MARDAFLVLLVGGVVAAGCSVRADEARDLCGLWRPEPESGFTFSDAQGRLEVASRRSLQEQDAVGRAALKGALARKLSQELGGASVRWSGASFRGPYRCGSYKVIVMAVDPLTFKVGDPQ